MKKITLATLLLLLAVPAWAQSSQPGASLTLKDTRGRRFSLANYKGKVVLLNFWATWCPPCRAEIPDLIKLQKQYRDQGLRIIGVTYPPQKSVEVRRYLRRVRVNYRIATGTKATKALFTRSETLPMTVIIDQGGVVQDVVEGIMYASEFEQKVKPLLASKSH
jgi:thiol-disulfide isomerase/thioredoxin